MATRLPTPEEVGIAIAKIRILADWGTSRLAKEAGIPVGTLSRIENGKNYPSLETLMRIAQVLTDGEIDVIIWVAIGHYTEAEALSADLLPKLSTKNNRSVVCGVCET